MLFIFDLDHTLIDSSHRQLTRPDGTLDLDHWRENCTREKIMLDQLLPLGRQVAHYLRHLPPGRTNIACTARVMGSADYDYLTAHHLRFDAILSRPEGCTLNDADLKEKLLRQFALTQRMPFRRLMKTAFFWDDNETIRDRFTSYGVTCYNPLKFNTENAQ